MIGVSHRRSPHSRDVRPYLHIHGASVAWNIVYFPRRIRRGARENIALTRRAPHVDQVTVSSGAAVQLKVTEGADSTAPGAGLVITPADCRRRRQLRSWFRHIPFH